jgi:hypothetical protein
MAQLMNRIGNITGPSVRLALTCLIAGILALIALQCPCASAKPKNDPENDTPSVPSPQLPSDVNQANLRVAALDTLYELDLSVDQLRSLQKLARDAGSARPRSDISNARFASLLKRFQDALLAGDNDQTIARLRGEVVDQIESVEGLDDQIEPTGPALNHAPEFCRNLKASQIAAFLASHADEVSDPAERMVEAVEEIRAAPASDAVGIGRKIANDIAHMVAGLDQDKSKTVADQVMEWLKQQPGSKDQMTDAERAKLEESAAKVIGEVSNMDVLEHWLQTQMAVLLSNPQLPDAISALGNAKLLAQKNERAEHEAAGN